MSYNIAVRMLTSFATVTGVGPVYMSDTSYNSCLIIRSMVNVISLLHAVFYITIAHLLHFYQCVIGWEILCQFERHVLLWQNVLDRKYFIAQLEALSLYRKQNHWKYRIIYCMMEVGRLLLEITLVSTINYKYAPFIVLRTLLTDSCKGTVLRWEPLSIRIQRKNLTVIFINKKSDHFIKTHRFHHAINWSTSPLSSGSSSNSRILL